MALSSQSGSGAGFPDMNKMAYANPKGPYNPYITYVDGSGYGEYFQIGYHPSRGHFFDGYGDSNLYKSFIPKENCWAQVYYLPWGTDHNMITLDKNLMPPYWMPLTKGQTYPLMIFTEITPYNQRMHQVYISMPDRIHVLISYHLYVLYQ